MGAHCIGHPQAGTQVVGIGDPVQDQQQGRLLQGVEHVVQGHLALVGVHLGHHALVPLARGQAVEALGVGGNDADALGLRMAQQVLGPGVLAALVQVHLLHRIRIVAQLGDDGMEAVDEAGGVILFGSGLGHGEAIGNGSGRHCRPRPGPAPARRRQEKCLARPIGPG